MRILSDELYTLVLENSPTLNIQGFFNGGGRFMMLRCFIMPLSRVGRYLYLARVLPPFLALQVEAVIFILNVGRQTDRYMKFGVVDRVI